MNVFAFYYFLMVGGDQHSPLYTSHRKLVSFFALHIRPTQINDPNGVSHLISYEHGNIVFAKSNVFENLNRLL